MKFLKALSVSTMIVLAIAVLPACKAKKAVTKPAPPAPVEKPAPPPPAPKPVETPPPPPPAPPKPDYNFQNIQFEFNSGILRTDSYPILDHAVTEMKKDPSVKFVLNGYASAEGTDEHNLELSVERANSVKVYLVNSGINPDNITTKGWGEKNPIADNTTEDGRKLNRRVEIKLAN